MWSAVGNDPPWDIIVTSPLLRCQAFADELGSRYGIAVAVEPRIKELGFGVWQGKTQEELATLYDPGVMQRFLRDPMTNRPKDAEGLGDFRERVVAALQQVVEMYAGKHVLMVCHAGVIRLVIAHILDVPLSNLFRIKVESAMITRVECLDRGDDFLGQLVFHGREL
jgi:alpha-ribazole phosphatase/probable phosphoglycerate mutase